MSEYQVPMIIERSPKKTAKKRYKRLPSLIESKRAVAPFLFEPEWQTGDDTESLQFQEGGIFSKQVKGQIG